MSSRVLEFGGVTTERWSRSDALDNEKILLK
jgi:hypothetical protein